MPGFDIKKFLDENRNMPPEQRDRILRKMVAGTSGAAMPSGGGAMPVLTPSSVETEPAPWRPKPPALAGPEEPEDIRQAHELDVEHPYYAKFRKPATELAAKGTGFLLGGPQGLRTPTSLDYSIARGVVPQTPEDAAIQAAMLATGAGELGFGEKIGLPALTRGTGFVLRPALRMGAVGTAGGLGSMAGGGEFLPGFAKGAALQGGGEILGGGARILGSELGKNWLINKTVGDLGGVLNEAIPEMGVPLRNAADFETAFIGGDNAPAVKSVQGAMDSFQTNLPKRIGGMPFFASGTPLRLEVPAPEPGYYPTPKAPTTQDVSFPVAQKKVNSLFAEGKFKEADALRKQIADQLNRVPGLGDEYLGLQRRLEATKAISKLITAKGQTLFRDPELIQNKLQEAFGQGRVAEEMVDLLGADQWEQIMGALRRGVKGPAYDVPSQRPHIGFRGGMGGVHPHISMPHTYRGVGNIPLLMQPPKAPFAYTLSTLLNREAEE